MMEMELQIHKMLIVGARHCQSLPPLNLHWDDQVMLILIYLLMVQPYLQKMILVLSLLKLLLLNRVPAMME
jgi:hypothetical protein